MSNISIIKNHSQVIGSTSLDKIFDLIKNPESPYRATIEEIRQLYMSGGAYEADQLKKTLPAITCSGIFAKRRLTKNLDAYSGMLILDLDDLLPGSVKQTKSIIEGIPYTHMCFVSPSGLGLKAVVKVDSGANEHKSAYEQVKELYEGETGMPFDKTSDVARLAYISYDPDAYFNGSSLVFKVDLGKVKKKRVTSAELSDYKMTCAEDMEICFAKAVTLTERSLKFEEGQRNNFVYQLACNGNRYGIAAEVMLNACLEKYSQGWNDEEVGAVVSGVYNRYPDQAGIWKNQHGTAIGLEDETTDTKNQAEEGEPENTPMIPDHIVSGMPEIIRNIAMLLTTNRERDTFITGSLSVLSGCLDSIQGIYDGSVVYPNIFTFILAPAASGKGVLKIARELGTDLHKKLLTKSQDTLLQYERDLERYKSARRNGEEMEKPEKPPFVMLFVPGNSSSAVIYDHLNDCGGLGIVCETEADTVNNCLKNDWGDYSDLLRKAFQHEAATTRRKTDNRYIEVNNPRLSVVLSGTPSQIKGIIKSAEDGLFSRFIYYRYQVTRSWRDVSPGNGKAELPMLVAKKAKEVTSMYEYLADNPTIFELANLQWEKLNSKFTEWLTNVACFVTAEAGATVTRLGLCTFRIAMILTAIRKYELKIKDRKMVCTDEHFEMALELISVYLQHAMVMYKELPSVTDKLDGKLKKFFDLLPIEFTREKAKNLANSNGLNVSDSWVDKWLKRLVSYGYLVKPDYNLYMKVQNNTTDKILPPNNQVLPLQMAREEYAA